MWPTVGSGSVRKTNKEKLTFKNGSTIYFGEPKEKLVGARPVPMYQGPEHRSKRVGRATTTARLLFLSFVLILCTPICIALRFTKKDDV